MIFQHVIYEFSKAHGLDLWGFSILTPMPHSTNMVASLNVFSAMMFARSTPIFTSPCKPGIPSGWSLLLHDELDSNKRMHTSKIEVETVKWYYTTLTNKCPCTTHWLVPVLILGHLAGLNVLQGGAKWAYLTLQTIASECSAEMVVAWLMSSMGSSFKSTTLAMKPTLPSSLLKTPCPAKISIVERTDAAKGFDGVELSEIVDTPAVIRSDVPVSPHQHVLDAIFLRRWGRLFFFGAGFGVASRLGTVSSP